MSYERFFLKDGGFLYVEVDNNVACAEGPMQASLSSEGDSCFCLTDEIERAGEALRGIAQGLQDKLGDICPDKLELEAGFDFTQKAGIVLVSGTGGAHIAIKMTWERDNELS